MQGDPGARTRCIGVVFFQRETVACFHDLLLWGEQNRFFGPLAYVFNKSIAETITSGGVSGVVVLIAAFFTYPF